MKGVISWLRNIVRKLASSLQLRMDEFEIVDKGDVDMDKAHHQPLGTPKSTDGTPELSGPKDIKLMSTLVTVLLDESGSMQPQLKDVIGSYNSFLKNQQKVQTDEARLILLSFNDNVKVVHGAIPIGNVKALSPSDYKPLGSTGLYDAIAEGIRITEGACAGQEGERVLFLIITDGEENASKKMTSTSLKSLMQDKEQRGNWTFSYVGPTPEQWAARMSQPVLNSRGYSNEPGSFGDNMRDIDSSVGNYRRTRKLRTDNFFQP